jgi:hypothetical protein
VVGTLSQYHVSVFFLKSTLNLHSSRIGAEPLYSAALFSASKAKQLLGYGAVLADMNKLNYL